MNETLGVTEDGGLYRRIFFPSASVLITIACVGFYGHSSIIFATLKFKYLHNPCNILIALLALGDFGHQMGQVPYAFLIFSGITFVSQRTCYWIQLIPALCMQHTIINIISLGMDRFYCICVPVHYQRISKFYSPKLWYLVIVNIPAVIFSLWLAAVSYVEMEKDPKKDTLCLIAAFFAGDAQDLWAISTAMLTGLAVIIYIIIWIVVWKKANVISSIKNTLKPLTVILFLTFIGWFIGMVVAAVIYKQTEWPVNLRIGWSAYAGLSINASIASNYFVYKFFGSDYKRAFKNLWKKDVTITPNTSQNISR